MTAPDDWISDETEEKERQYRGLLDMHVKICRSVLAQPWCPSSYLYADLHAGPGNLERDDRKFDGSPLIFLDAATRHGVEFEMLCFERKPDVAARLTAAIADRTGGQIPNPVRVEPLEQGLPRWLASAGRHPYRRGLVYADPIGTEIPHETLACAARMLPKVDILCYVSATGYKRRRGANPDWAKLADHIAAIPKRYVRIRQPLGRQQWTFVLWTNWDRFPTWKNIGFHDVRSDDGRRVFDKLNLNSRELHEANNTPLPLTGTES